MYDYILYFQIRILVNIFSEAHTKILYLNINSQTQLNIIIATQKIDKWK